MEESGKEQEGINQSSRIKTFPVPFALREVNKNIAISTNTPSKTSKEQIIKQAFKFHSQGNISKAVQYYRYFINQGFKNDRIFANYGVILRDQGKLKEAELLQRQAIELNPNFAEAYSNLGNIFRDFGNLEEAELSTRKAIELNPDFVEAHSNLGNIFKDLGNLEKAEISARNAIELNPNFAEAHSNLGLILYDLGQLQEAKLSICKAVEINPNYAKAHLNLGNVLRDLGYLEEAELSIRKAITLNPNFAEAYLNLSMIELLKGDYKNGLENYEFRWKKKQPIILHASPKIDPIDYKTLQKGAKFLVVSEQGLGDTIQYMRYIPYLRNQGLDITFSAQTKLHSLIQSSGIDQNPLAPEQSILVADHPWVPLLSLPRYLKVTPKNPIITEPYISSSNELNEKWKNILSTEQRPIIGINWQGNPNAEKNNLKGRSLPLETFSNIVGNNNFKFLSLQKGYGSEQLEHCSFKNRFVQCQAKVNSCWDFLENAAIINNCDLIITSDTAIAHLAGGMGKFTWLMLQYVPEWRWGIEGDSTFWYPSMRLFRQKERHNWQEVMVRITNQLNKKEWK